MTNSTTLHRLWNVAPIRTMNLIETGIIDRQFNQKLSDAAMSYFDRFTGTSSNSSTGISTVRDNDIILYDNGNGDSKSVKRRRKRMKTSSGLVKSSASSLSSSNDIMENNNTMVNPKSGLTKNDYFFEQQKINGYCENYMKESNEIQILQHLLSKEAQTYLSDIGNIIGNVGNDTTSIYTSTSININTCGGNHKDRYKYKYDAIEIASKLKNEGTVKLDMWAAILVGAGAYHADHVHENVFVSGVYYAAVPEGSSPLRLHRPTQIQNDNRDLSTTNSTCSNVISTDECYENNPHHHFHEDNNTFELYPQEGQVFIFPPWLLHGVPPLKDDSNEMKPRISFAFNISGAVLINNDPWDVTKI